MNEPLNDALREPMGKLHIDVQRAAESGATPVDSEFAAWVRAALDGRRTAAEICIRIVGREESQALNLAWRAIDRPTNVLSFPADLPAGHPSALLGDLVLCAPLLREEATQQAKAVRAHWAHLVVHGTLHLLGMDHRVEAEAIAMEAEEVAILETLGFADPYHCAAATTMNTQGARAKDV